MKRLLLFLASGAAALSVSHLLFEVIGAATNAFHDATDAWYTMSKTTSRAYICKAVHGVGNCTGPWESFQDACYAVFDNRGPDGAWAPDSQSEEKRKDDCAAEGGFLVSIHSDAENTFVHELCSSVRPQPVCWIGLSRSDASSEDWAWDDGSAFDYSNWGRARDASGTQYSEQTLAAMGKWDRPDGGITYGVFNVVVMSVGLVTMIMAIRQRNPGLLCFSIGVDCCCAALCSIGLLALVIFLTMDYAQYLPVLLMGGCQVACLCSLVLLRACSGSDALLYDHAPALATLHPAEQVVVGASGPDA